MIRIEIENVRATDRFIIRARVNINGKEQKFQQFSWINNKDDMATLGTFGYRMIEMGQQIVDTANTGSLIEEKV